jgi:hypothetical protein
MMRGSMIKIGSPSEWLEFSDHMPLVVELMADKKNVIDEGREHEIT